MLNTTIILRGPNPAFSRGPDERPQGFQRILQTLRRAFSRRDRSSLLTALLVRKPSSTSEDLEKESHTDDEGAGCIDPEKYTVPFSIRAPPRPPKSLARSISLRRILEAGTPARQLPPTHDLATSGNRDRDVEPRASFQSSTRGKSKMVGSRRDSDEIDPELRTHLDGAFGRSLSVPRAGDLVRDAIAKAETTLPSASGGWRRPRSADGPRREASHAGIATLVKKSHFDPSPLRARQRAGSCPSISTYAGSDRPQYASMRTQEALARQVQAIRNRLIAELDLDARSRDLAMQPDTLLNLV